MSESEQFSYLFSGSHSGGNDPYEMVLVLKDGSRWRLDPHQNKRLCQVVDPELVVRFEAIFPVSA